MLPEAPSQALARQLLDEILADPDDDHRRLVYADLLSERDDPRGAFITEQCQLASLEESDPRWSALYAKTERTLFQHREAWTAPLRERFEQERPPVSAFHFRRGFVDAVETGALGVELLSWLCDRTPLCGLSVPYGRWSRSLAAVRYGITERKISALTSHEDLLGLTSEELSRLRAVTLTSSWRQSWLPRLSCAPLRSLSVAHIDNTLAKELCGALDVSSLRQLSLTDSWFDGSTLEALTATPPGPPLSLSLARNTRLDVRDHIRALLSFREIRGLDLSESVTRPAIRRLCSSPTALSLRHLSLRGDRRQEREQDGAERIAEVPFEALTRLDLSYRKLSSDAASSLFSSQALSKLVSLDLSDTDIGDEGVIALTRSPIATLTRLSLQRAGLTDRGVAELCEWPGLKLVTSLDLDPTIGPEGIAALNQSKWLDPIRLDAGWPRAGDEGWESLRERFGAALVRG